MSLSSPAQESSRLARNATEKRNRILTAAQELFALNGYEAVTVSEIVQRAGVAQGTFYRYFPSKTELRGALIERMENALFAAVKKVFESARLDENPMPLPQVLRTMVYAALETVAPFRDLMGSLETETMLFGASTGARKRREPYLQFLTELLVARQELGEIPTGLNLSVTVRFLDTLLNLIARELVIGSENLETEAYLDGAIEFITQGLGLRKL